jgi:hypothetical protein
MQNAECGMGNGLSPVGVRIPHSAFAIPHSLLVFLPDSL